MKFKKLLAAGLSMALCAGMLAGCGGTGASDSGSAAQDEKDEPTNIIWMVRSSEPNNYDNVMKAVNEKLVQDINMTLDLRFIEPGDYNTKMQMAFAGGDEWDLCFTAAWANNYINAAGKGAFYKLSEEMLRENAPHVMEVIPERLWDGIKINGNIYALMNYQVMYSQGAYMFLKEAIDECNIDYQSIDSVEEVNDVLAAFKEKYPDRWPARGPSVNFTADKPVISQIMAMPFLAVDPETKKIDTELYINTFGVPEYETAMLWRNNGWCPPDSATLQDETAMLKAGKLMSRTQGNKPGLEAQLKLLYGNDWVTVPTGKKVIKTGSAQSTLTAVNVNSKNPEKAIQLFDYIFSNKEVANMLYFGLEGQDYDLVDGRVHHHEDGWLAPAWMLGNQFNSLLTENDVENVWEETIKGNETAEYELLFGFVPDRTPIETELANCEAIWGEYKDILNYGLKDYHEVLPELYDKLNKAGLEKVVAELQTQLDKFFAEQG